MKNNHMIIIAVVMAAAVLTAGEGRAEIIDLSLSGTATAESGEYIYELAPGDGSEDSPGPAVRVKQRFSGEPVVSFQEFQTGDKLLLKFKSLSILELGDTMVTIEISDEGPEMYSGYGRFFQVAVDDIFALGSGYYVEILAINYVSITDRHTVDIKVSPAGRAFQIGLELNRPVNIGPAILEIEKVPSFRQAVLYVCRPSEPFSSDSAAEPSPAGPGPALNAPRVRGFVNVIAKPKDGQLLLNTVISYRITSGDSRALYLKKLAAAVGFEVKGVKFVHGEESVSITMDRSTVAEALSILLRKGWDYTYDVDAKTIIVVPLQKK